MFLKITSQKNKALLAQRLNVAGHNKTLQQECIYWGDKTAFNTLFLQVQVMYWGNTMTGSCEAF